MNSNRRQWLLGAIAFAPIAIIILVSLAYGGSDATRAKRGATCMEDWSRSHASRYVGRTSDRDAQLIFCMTLQHPAGMVPVWAILYVGLVLGERTRTRRQTRLGISKLDAIRLMPLGSVERGLAELKLADPAFDEAAFFVRTVKVFLQIQRAWSARSLDGVRPFMSDGIYRRFTTLLTLMQLDDASSAPADVKVLSRQMQEVTRTPAFDHLTVSIVASRQEVEVPAGRSDNDALAKPWAERRVTFTELWTFVRPRGAQTQPGLGEGPCPSCGEVFTAASSVCTSCTAVVNSGKDDWVLTEITQPSAYLPMHGTPPGLDALQHRDPNAAPELLQDRGLLLFWKWLHARAVRDARILQKLATADAEEKLAAELGGMKQDAIRSAIHDPAVAGTSIAAIEQVGDLFRAHVDIRWSATLHGREISARSILTMVRAADAKTDPGVGFSSERCGHCGARLTASDSVRCDECGHELSSPARCWQFESIGPYEQWRRPVAYSPSASPRPVFATGGERLRLLGLMVAVVKADGVLSRREVSLLRDCADRWSIPWPRVQNLLQADGDETFGLLPPQMPAEARAFVEQLVQLARIDGRIDWKERDLISRAGAKLGLDGPSIDSLLKSEGQE